MSKFSLPCRLGLATAILIGGTMAAQAAPMPETVDPAPGQHISPAELQDRLERLGFTHVDPVNKEGDVYNVTARWEGRPLDLDIDANHGGIRVEDAGPPPSAGATVYPAPADRLTETELRGALARAGYTDIGPLVLHGGEVTTTAIRNGRVVDLSIDAETGLIREGTASDTAVVPQHGDAIASGMTVDEMERLLAPLGYDEVTAVVQEGDFYTVEAYRGGERVVLRVDAEAGVVRTLP